VTICYDTVDIDLLVKNATDYCLFSGHRFENGLKECILDGILNHGIC
jgi:hypothetical protein